MLCFLKNLLILFETKVIFDSVAYLIIVIFENDYFSKVIFDSVAYLIIVIFENDYFSICGKGKIQPSMNLFSYRQPEI